MAWRLAKSLEKFRDQINQQFPSRSKLSDGTIGDAAHASRDSDHNPHVREGSMGVVTAIDITHDPRTGCDTWTMAEQLRQSRDPRIKYIISNKRICSSTTSPWTWRTYTGSNPHSHHIHVSVHSTKAHYDDTRDWQLNFAGMEISSAGDTLPERPLLRRGSKGEHVRTVQRLLGVAVDGDFGARTEAAVREFQMEEGIGNDGIVGPVTWGKLDEIEAV